MASVGHPITGDALYGRKKQHYNTEGQVLHAKELAFFHPVNNTFLSFKTEWPIYFNKILHKINKSL
jgi:23S rRNA pseudouridine1911/1915/1917 synthase